MSGEEIIIMKSGKQLVRLVPVEMAPQKRTLGTAKGEVVVPDNFNDALDVALLDGFE